jgi:hypothetical protein
VVLLNHSISQHLARNTAALSWRSYDTAPWKTVVLFASG